MAAATSSSRRCSPTSRDQPRRPRGDLRPGRRRSRPARGRGGRRARERHPVRPDRRPVHPGPRQGAPLRTRHPRRRRQGQPRPRGSSSRRRSAACARARAAHASRARWPATSSRNGRPFTSTLPRRMSIRDGSNGSVSARRPARAPDLREAAPTARTTGSRSRAPRGRAASTPSSTRRTDSTCRCTACPRGAASSCSRTTSSTVRRPRRRGERRAEPLRPAERRLGRLGNEPGARRRVLAASARGQDQLVAVLEDAVRAADHGVRSVLLADVGACTPLRDCAPPASCPLRCRPRSRSCSWSRTRRPPGPRGARRLDAEPAAGSLAGADRRDQGGGRPADRLLRRGSGHARRLRPAARDPGADPGRRPVYVKFGLQRAGRVSVGDTHRADRDRALARARAAGTPGPRAARTLRVRRRPLRARRRRPGRSGAGLRART